MVGFKKMYYLIHMVTNNNLKYTSNIREDFVLILSYIVHANECDYQSKN
jgi:hypothetical protein